MKKEQLTLCLLNGISSMGYSLIAPLFPPLFKERGIENLIVSFLIVIICTQILYQQYFAHIFHRNLGN